MLRRDTEDRRDRTDRDDAREFTAGAKSSRRGSTRSTRDSTPAATSLGRNRLLEGPEDIVLDNICEDVDDCGTEESSPAAIICIVARICAARRDLSWSGSGAGIEGDWGNWSPAVAWVDSPSSLASERVPSMLASGRGTRSGRLGASTRRWCARVLGRVPV